MSIDAIVVVVHIVRDRDAVGRTDLTLPDGRAACVIGVPLNACVTCRALDLSEARCVLCGGDGDFLGHADRLVRCATCTAGLLKAGRVHAMNAPQQPGERVH